MPPGLQYSIARITLHEFPVGTDRHRADDFPLARVVIEADQGGFLARREFLSRLRIGQIGKTRGHRAVEIGRAIRLHGDDKW